MTLISIPVAALCGLVKNFGHAIQFLCLTKDLEKIQIFLNPNSKILV